MIVPKHLDLFSGIGGFSLAFEAAGFQTIAFAETDPKASARLKKNFPTVPNLGDVRKLCIRATDCVPAPGDYLWCPRCEQEFGECECVGTDQFTDTYGFPHVLTAGFPCQDISKAHNCGGKGNYNRQTKGVRGKRSGLVFEAIRIARELRPVFCLFENVCNLRTQGADEILAALEAENYAAEACVVGAWSAGADHERNRAFIVAYDKGIRMEGLRTARVEFPHPLAETLLPVRTRDGEWEVEPDVRRAVHGISDWVDRLKLLGNAVVPQVVFPFAKFFHQHLTQ